MSKTPVQAATSYAGTFPGQAEEAARVRREIAAYLGNCPVTQDMILIAPWRPRQPGDRPHGLDIIQALTGPDGWGTQPADTGGRIVWARLSW